ncbi:MAG: D-alanine--D-alanine ligase [Bacteroidota bacterium]
MSHWEYWPMELIYYPIFPVWLYYAIKAKSFFFFSAANPSIKNGGMAMESKKEIYDIIPSQYIPKTILIPKQTPLDTVLNEIKEAGIRYPMIAKPDIGLKAFAVDKIKNEKELQTYISKISDDFLIQDLIPYPNEVGIFYVRLPGEKKGRITGIVSKEFLSVTGDGKRSIKELIKQNPRSYFQLSELIRKHGEDVLQGVLPKDEKFILVPYGSHTRGAKFIDESHRRNEALLETIDSICKQIPDFYFGRLDILYNNFEELSQGENFSIIEVNGAGSEPTHIYDPGHSLFYAWKEIFKHWKLLYSISAINNRKGHHYLSFKDGRAMLRANKELEEQLKVI